MVDWYLSPFINLYISISYILKSIFCELIIPIPVVVLRYFPCGFSTLTFPSQDQPEELNQFPRKEKFPEIFKARIKLSSVVCCFKYS